MIANRNDDPLPAEELGKRLCHTFGRYRWNFIYADAPVDREAKTEWRTETRYPIKHRVLFRQWQEAEKLVGVRFESDTLYAVIDIDAGSKYHPKNDSGDGLGTIQTALETIGISRTIIISSSWSDGLHLYIPLAELVNTFQLACTIKGCLEAQGFELGLGQLEIFPNPKPYGTTIKTQYLAHRLPLQPESGSHLIDKDFNFVSNQLSDFFAAWDMAAAGQDLAALATAMSIAKDNRLQRPRRRLNKSEDWRKDLETVINAGWTGPSQTNGLLKQIATYGVVFLGKSGEDLANYIYDTAINSPGYRQWCRHQREIERRAECWANSVDGYYWPIGTRPKRETAIANNIVPFNQRQSDSAAKRIAAAVEELESNNVLPERPTARAHAIRAIAGCSFATLYAVEHKPFWHPDEYKPKEPVMAGQPRDVEPHPLSTAEAQNIPKPLQSGELHPKPPVMKCCTSEIPPEKSKTSYRGGRGDGKSFPQASPPLLKRVELPSDQKPVRTEGIDAEMDVLIQSFQTKVHELGWRWEETQAFINKTLPGKRPSQMTKDDRVLLLYSLQNEERKALASLTRSERSSG